MENPEPLPIQARAVVAWIKELGTTGIAVLLVAFYLGQQAGWIPNIDRDDHHLIKNETIAQTIILRENQRLMAVSIEQARINQESLSQLARGICISVTKTSEIERRCLGQDPGRH